MNLTPPRIAPWWVQCPHKFERCEYADPAVYAEAEVDAVVAENNGGVVSLCAVFGIGSSP